VNKASSVMFDRAKESMPRNMRHMLGGPYACQQNSSRFSHPRPVLTCNIVLSLAQTRSLDRRVMHGPKEHY